MRCDAQKNAPGMRPVRDGASNRSDVNRTFVFVRKKARGERRRTRVESGGARFSVLKNASSGSVAPVRPRARKRAVSSELPASRDGCGACPCGQRFARRAGETGGGVFAGARPSDCGSAPTGDARAGRHRPRSFGGPWWRRGRSYSGAWQRGVVRGCVRRSPPSRETRLILVAFVSIAALWRTVVSNATLPSYIPLHCRR